MESSMTAQEVFDKVVTHLRAQGVKASDVDGCLYRGPEGTSCAAGCLISDEEYNRSMERTRISELLNRNSTPESLKQRLLPHINLLSQLQSVHDEYEVQEWEHHLSKVAERFGLTYTAKA